MIKVENLSKSYRIRTSKNEKYVSLRDALANSFSFKRTQHVQEDFFALRDINFQVNQGDRVGIIGRNGAGKSTLLKILSRITEPTSGRISIDGRVSSLLEVGTGFHPELTGRENIYLNGAILGMSRSEISRKFDEIVSFAEIEQFLETPVKRYSSGMYVRLAFAVAAHLEPEILIVDEVLAVGDAQFQRKCLGKMDEVSKKDGRTILFVSHNIGAIRSLCSTGILLQNGKLTSSGEIGAVIDSYENSSESLSEGIWNNITWDNSVAKFDFIAVSNHASETRSIFLNTQEIQVSMQCSFRKQAEYVKIGFDLIKDGHVVFRAQQVDANLRHTFSENETCKFTCTIPEHFLNHGVYFIRPLFSIHNVETLLNTYDSVLRFQVDLDKDSYFKLVLDEGNFPGFIFPKLNWKLDA